MTTAVSGRFILGFLCLGLLATPLHAQSDFELIHGDLQRRMKAMKLDGSPDGASIQAPVPTPGQLLFDVLHYDLDLAFNPGTHEVDGVVRTQLTSLVDSLFTLDIDADDALSIASVTIAADDTLSWSRPSGLVAINLTTGLGLGDTLEIDIAFHGFPDAALNPGLFFRTQSSIPLIYSLSEPWSARSWWPCKDYPDDKATFDLYLAVPDNLFAASNGTYLGEQAVIRWGAPYIRYHWSESYPMSTYLASVAATEYVKLTDAFVYAPGDTMAITHYVYSSKVAAAQEDFNVTVPMLDFLSSTFGLYPFVDEKYGVALCAIGGGMEHQTLTSYGAALVRGDHSYDWVYVHELAHMWFGDLITCQNWPEIWLNEGFAAYSEALWFEHLNGPAELRAYMEGKDRPDRWDGPILRQPDSTDPWYYFDNVVYGKAAWVLHMLRHIVGDTAFFQILQNYVADPQLRFGVATTADFVAACEAVYGSPLNWFFDAWLTREDRPQYDWTWHTYTWAGKTQLSIVVNQLQAVPYSMPVDFRITTATAQIDTVLWVSATNESFLIALDDTVNSVEIDPDHWILRDLSQYTTSIQQPPTTTYLWQNRPNPFNPTTRIRFSLAESAQIVLRVYDVRGALVSTLLDGQCESGPHEVVWRGVDAANIPLASGLYIYQLNAGQQRLTRKMLLVR